MVNFFGLYFVFYIASLLVLSISFVIIKQIICLVREGEWSKDCERRQVNKCRQNFREQQNNWRVQEPIM